ncbi:MAG: L-2-amino-thiazoline-4-carboxylic acid hydrolase [Desulfovibrionaceae bacterium]
MSEISRLDQRKIEAALLARMYEVLTDAYGPERALELVREAVERDSEAAGRAFASAAPGGVPSLEHFLTVVDSWRGSGALEVGEVRREGGRAAFDVTRCEYVRAYREMGIAGELLPVIACGRDEPFARGYSGKLAMDRPGTIGLGSAACGFAFSWKE